MNASERSEYNNTKQIWLEAYNGASCLFIVYMKPLRKTSRHIYIFNNAFAVPHLIIFCKRDKHIVFQKTSSWFSEFFDDGSAIRGFVSIGWKKKN